MVTDLSGVLEHKKVVKVVDKKGNFLRHEERPLFTVNENGSISVESMRGTKYYSYAQECDSEHKNGWLQGSEIIKFLKKFSDRDIKTNTNDLVYYKETTEKGGVTRICAIMDKSKSEKGEQQCSFYFDGTGVLKKQVLYQTPGHEFSGTYTYDLESGMVTATNDEGVTFINRPMDKDNYKNACRAASATRSQKETIESKIKKWLKSW